MKKQNGDKAIRFLSSRRDWKKENADKSKRNNEK
jgi:hypothetical protein